MRPQSIHEWRQTDCLSITLNYYIQHLPFFEPRLHHAYGNEGKTVAEFPILYYATAQLYHVFGEKEFILRLLNVIIFCTGLFFLSKIIRKLTGNFIFSIAAPLVFFCSTIVAYYTCNFLPDIPSLGISMVSWYFFISYYEQGNMRHLVIACLLITLAALIKISAFIVFGALLLFYGIELLKGNRKWNWTVSILLMSPIIINFLWIVYANDYQRTNGNFYFLMNVKPIWAISTEGAYDVWQRITTSEQWGWRKDILPPFLWYASLPSFIVVILQARKNNVAMIISLAILIGIVYTLLLFPQFYHHDYYLIPLISLLILSLLYTLNMVMNKLQNKRIEIGIYAVLLLFGIHQSGTNLRLRYEMTSIFSPYVHLRDTIPIPESSRVISMSDISYCGSLYFINRIGWTNLNVNKNDPEHQYIIDPRRSELNTPEYISEQIEKRISKGAEYLIFLREDTLIAYMPPAYLSDHTYQDDNITIYKLK